MAIIIDSIYRMQRRWLTSQFFEKLSEGRKAEFYSTATIIIKCFISWICASTLSVRERFVFRGVPLTVLSHSSYYAFPIKTSTTLSMLSS